MSVLPMPLPRILIVDDEPHVRKFLRLSLQAEGFDPLEATTAEQALVLVHTAKPALMILDIGLPDIDGRQVIRDVRLTNEMPILVLSARAEDSEKIATLEQGADDYMTKPFAVRELVERVRAALQQQEARLNWIDSGVLRTGALQIHLRQREVLFEGKSIVLDEDEYTLLRLLAIHGGRVLTFGRIERALWGQENELGRQIDLQKRVNALRHKLEAEPSFPRYIMTEPAVGYRLAILPLAEA
ncbi:MAG: response regulator transcription factor [Pseudomonadota bacterium]|nr:response regulator transcription factor [Pseudomonadota bacterium]